jgi:hypothetical protein
MYWNITISGLYTSIRPYSDFVWNSINTAVCFFWVVMRRKVCIISCLFSVLNHIITKFMRKCFFLSFKSNVYSNVKALARCFYGYLFLDGWSVAGKKFRKFSNKDDYQSFLCTGNHCCIGIRPWIQSFHQKITIHYKKTKAHLMLKFAQSNMSFPSLHNKMNNHQQWIVKIWALFELFQQKAQIRVVVFLLICPKIKLESTLKNILN